MRCSKLTMVLRIAPWPRSPRRSCPPAAAAAAPPTIEPLRRCYVAAQADQTQSVTIDGHGLHAVRADRRLPRRPARSRPAIRRAAGRRQRRRQGHGPGAVRAARRAPLHVAAGRAGEHREQRDPASRVANAVGAAAARSAAATGARVRFRGPRLHRAGRGLRALRLRGQVRARRCGWPSRPATAGRSRASIRQFPFRRSPKVGSWTIQFDQRAPLQPDAAVRAAAGVKVSRTIKPKR